MQANQEPLKAVSNVIELKPDRKYLLVFKGENISPEAIEMLQERIAAMGISTLAINLYDDLEMQVIEVPEETSNA